MEAWQVLNVWMVQKAQTANIWVGTLKGSTDRYDRRRAEMVSDSALAWDSGKSSSSGWIISTVGFHHGRLGRVLSKGLWLARLGSLGSLDAGTNGLNAQFCRWRF
jgi:hypothetical protein